MNINISSEDILYLVCDTFALCCSPTKQDNVMTVSNGQFAAIEFLLKMTAMSSISGHIGFSNCHSLERTFQFDTEILHRKSGRLFSRFLNACLTPLNVTIQG